jgi:hypothetical protein
MNKESTMINAADFRTLTGVELNATPDKLEKKLGEQVQKETASQIAIALIARTLIVEHSWKVASAAARVGLTQGQASTAGARGKVLYETGADSASIVWQTVRTLSGKDLTEMAETLQAMTGEEARTALAIRVGVRKVVVGRLADNATPETIDALTDEILADGHRTPTAARGVIDGIATRLGIELPKSQQSGPRPGSSSNSADEKADIPTFDQALMGALAAVKRVHEGTSDEYPLTLTSVQASLVDTLMTELLAIMDLATVSA